MLAFRAVHSLRWSLVTALLLQGSAATALAAGNKITLSLELDTPAAVRGGQTGLVVWADVERGWHINAHKPNDSFLIPTEASFTLPLGISTDTVNYPRPDRHTFAFAPGKELLVYEGKVGITTALNVPADFIGTRIRIEAVLRYQACNDTTCLPPASVSAELLVPISADVVTAPDKEPLRHGVDLDIGAWLAQRGLAVTLLLTMLLGLGLNLTPCVYPLISVTVSYFGTQGHHHPLRAAALAAVYVLGITLSFAVVGVGAALSGGIFGAALQKPPVLLFIAAVLVVLALSSFGVYELRPPAWILRRVSGSAHGMLGALFMGLTMGIVAAPCVGPVVVGLLVFVGSQQSVQLGLALFFALGLGMGLPYLGLALAAGSLKRLPRSGEWLLWVERLFGFLLLGLAAYFIAPLLPQGLSRFVLPSLILVGGIYLGFIDRSGRSLRYFRSIQRLVGVGAVGLAVWIAVPQRAESAIRWEPFAPSSIAAAVRSGRPSLVDFIADWCIPCHEMERTTYTDPAVREQAERFAMFKADITRENDATSDLVDQYAVRGVPTMILIDSSGTEVHRLVGYIGADELVAAMRAVN